MAWPNNSTPKSGGVWLECNGQSIPAEYKKLRELIGDKVPDYQGVFLRGYGSRSFSQNNGKNADSSTTYKSGELGSVQGDSMRKFLGMTGGFDYDMRTINAAIRAQNNQKYNIFEHSVDSSVKRSIISTDVTAGDTLRNNGMGYVTYSLSGSKDSGYWLSETYHSFPVRYTHMQVIQNLDSTRVLPTDNEIRPINMAVKYFIKAR